MFNLLNIFGPKQNPVINPMVLLVLDGYGIAPPSAGNAIDLARKPVMDYLRANYPNGELIAAGESVGLPANEAGNSEVGHLTIGAGRVIFQSVMRINLQIKDGSFFKNRALLDAIEYAKANNSNLHLMGLVSSGSVHSSTPHLMALLQLCKQANFNRVVLHLFTDGRDAPPRDASAVISKIVANIAELKIGTIATISGRYFAMDRDFRWDRTKKAYDAIVSGSGVRVIGPNEAIEAAYAANLTDEFIEPTIIGDYQGMRDTEAAIFFNFRVDRPRQLTMALTMPDFENLKSFEFSNETLHGKIEVEKKSGPTFKRSRVPKNLFMTTMTMYQKNIPVSAVAYPPLTVSDPLSKILSDNGLLQLQMAESEKERMVTHYFNGLSDEKIPGQEVVIIPSPRVKTYDLKPEMAVLKIVQRLDKELMRQKYHFVVVNFASPDMVAHTGNTQATVRAIETVDRAIGIMFSTISRLGGTLVITADHGNAEDLLTYPTSSFFFTTDSGKVNTEHSNNPVPLLILNSLFKGKNLKLPRGTLSDVAPTILSMMKLTKTSGMTGNILLPQ